MAITAPATSSTLAVADGKTLTASNTLTLAGTDSTVMTFPATSATIARTDAANTFTGVQSMTSPALTTPVITTDLHSTTAGTATVGSAALPFGSAYLGTAATNNQRLLPTATSAARVINIADQGTNGAVAIGDQADASKVFLLDSHSATASTVLTLAEAITSSRTVTFPDASITVPGTVATDCGTSAGACSTALKSSILKIVTGEAAATSASPSTVAITGMPAFTSTTSFQCFAQNTTTAANVFSVLAAGYVSTSAVTFTGPNTLTDGIRWMCIGY